MSLKFGKRELEQMIATLEADYDNVADAARAVLETAEEIYNARASFIVVGQVVATKEKGRIHPSDPDAVKVALGSYSTAGDAQKAAESLWSSTASGDNLRVWVLDFFHGTPAAWHGKQRDKYSEAQAKRKKAQDDKVRESIERRQQEMQQLADESKERKAA